VLKDLTLFAPKFGKPILSRKESADDVKSKIFAR
jgi:hypothetical protein